MPRKLTEIQVAMLKCLARYKHAWVPGQHYSRNAFIGRMNTYRSLVARQMVFDDRYELTNSGKLTLAAYLYDEFVAGRGIKGE